MRKIPGITEKPGRDRSVSFLRGRKKVAHIRPGEGGVGWIVAVKGKRWPLPEGDPRRSISSDGTWPVAYADSRDEARALVLRRLAGEAPEAPSAPRAPIAYRLTPVFDDAGEDGFGLATAAVMFCMVTGETLAGMGGGGDFVSPAVFRALRNARGGAVVGRARLGALRTVAEAAIALLDAEDAKASKAERARALKRLLDATRSDRPTLSEEDIFPKLDTP